MKKPYSAQQYLRRDYTKGENKKAVNEIRRGCKNTLNG